MSILSGWFADRAAGLSGVGAGYVAPPAPLSGVAFNGSTMLYGLPTHAAVATCSLCVWVHFGASVGGGITPDPTTGVFLRTNTGQTNTDHFLQFMPNQDDAAPDPTGLGARVDDDHTFVGSGYSTWPDRWRLLMASVRMIDNGNGTGTTTRLIYLDDDAIINDTHIEANLVGETVNFNFDVADYTDVQGFHAAAIGAKYLTSGTGDNDQTDPTPAGTGLKCGLANFWFDPGRFVDWSNSANRAKFGTLSSGAYHPVGVGVDGSAPFGSAPHIFLSGNAASFVTNLGAGGGTLSVAGTLATVTGPA